MYPPREDYAGARWLVTNRGIAKRAVFETRQDVERFYEALGVVVALGLLEVHAFVVMTTHFHLLVTSSRGEISHAMQLLTNAFVRWWNRARERDGPLFARRFHGRKIEDEGHLSAVVRYIDLNPVRARMCRAPSEHPWASARAYRYELGPEWLSRDLVRSLVAADSAPSPLVAADYDAFAAAVDPEVNAYVIERAARRPDRRAPPLHDLIRTASLRQQGWMEWKAALADGMAVGTAFLTPAAVLRAARVIARSLARRPLPVPTPRLERDAAAGLLRAAAGRTVTEVATDLAVARSTALAAIRRHDAWMNAMPRYADMVARALQNAVRRTLPPPTSPLALPARVRSGGANEPR